MLIVVGDDVSVGEHSGSCLGVVPRVRCGRQGENHREDELQTRLLTNKRSVRGLVKAQSKVHVVVVKNLLQHQQPVVEDARRCPAATSASR